MFTNYRKKSDLMQSAPDDIIEGASRVIAKATLRHEYEGGGFAIQYHDTVVYERLGDGSQIIDSGGYRTATTKNRINEYLEGAWVYQENWNWYVTSSWDDEPFEFVDGMSLTKDGRVIDYDEDLIAERDELSAQVDDFIAEMKRLIADGDGLPLPQAGDPWILGDSADAIATVALSNVQECYVNGTIIVALLRLKGWQDGAISHAYQRDQDWVIRPVKAMLRQLLGI